MVTHFKRHIPWAAAWLLASLVGAAFVARMEVLKLKQSFDTETQAVHRLLSQRVAQVEAVLTTLPTLPGTRAQNERSRGDGWLSGLGLSAFLAFAALATPGARAQVPPSSVEVARYAGLHAAAYRGDVVNVRSLILTKADINARDSYGRTAIQVATFARQRGAILALAQAGANLELLESDRYDAVTIAAVADDEETLKLLLSLGASAKLTTSRYDGTALIAAAHLGHDGVVKQLIAAGAPLDHVNNLHWTAMIESIVLGNGGPRHREVLQALIAARANTQLADRQGLTPLALAKARGYVPMVQMLEKAGAR